MRRAINCGEKVLTHSLEPQKQLFPWVLKGRGRHRTNLTATVQNAPQSIGPICKASLRPGAVAKLLKEPMSAYVPYKEGHVQIQIQAQLRVFAMNGFLQWGDGNVKRSIGNLNAY